MVDADGERILSDELTTAVRDGRGDAPTSVDTVVVNRGRFTGDLLWAEGAMFTLASQRLVKTLRDAGATGWRSVPAFVRYFNGEELPGYELLVVTGQCGDFFGNDNDFDRDGVVLTEPEPATEVADWDGTEVFWVRGRPQYTFCVTDRVRTAFKKAGLTRISYLHPAEL